jgi:spermidine synthase
VFVFSGAFGLVYESIWPHYLKLFLGHASYAQTLVLVVFIGGMAVGAGLCAKWSDRLRNPLRAYALVELVIGVIAMGFHPVFELATNWAYSYLLPHTCGAAGLCSSQWLLSALLILPQSILLGTTFPLMTAGVLRIAREHPGRKLALFYANNTLGGVVGVLASAFVLISTVGLPGSLLASGIGNVFLAIVVYGVSKKLPESREKAIASAVSSQVKVVENRRLLLWVAGLTGLSSFFYEIAWVRLLQLVLGASTHAFELMLASFLLGLALGGYWIRRRIDGNSNIPLTLAKVQIAMGFLAILTLPIYGQTFASMAWLYEALGKTREGYVLFNLGSASLALAIMLPATCAAGMTLPLITSLILREGASERAIGQVYAINTLGSILGVIAVVHLSLPLLGLKGSLILAGSIDIALGIVLLLRVHRMGKWPIPRLRVLAWPVAGLLIIAVAPWTFHLDVRQMASGVYRRGHPRVLDDRKMLFHKDGKTATIDVIQQPGNGDVSIHTNGKSDAAAFPMIDGRAPSPDATTMVMLGLAGPLHSPQARDVAVIGFGSGISTTTLLAFPFIRRVDTIEIEPAMVEGAHFFEPLVTPAYVDPRSTVIVDDAKSYFARSGNRYDVILSEPSNPWVSGVSGLFSQEFYARIRRHLRPSGVLVQWIQLYEITPNLVASMLQALSSEFSDYVVYETGTGDMITVATPDGLLPPLPDKGSRLFPLLPAVNRLAAWVGLARPADWSTRRLGGKRLIDPYVESCHMPSNSDYFPLVDQHAAQARFMKATADEITQLRVSPVPLGMFYGEPEAMADGPADIGRLGLGEHQRALAIARESFREIVGPSAAAPTTLYLESPAYGQNSRWLAAKTNCSWPADGPGVVDFVLRMTSETLPYLTGREIDRWAQALSEHDCVRRQQANLEPWLRLLTAMGSRDFPAMVAASGVLRGRPDTKTSSVQTEFIVMAHLGALIALGEFQEAGIVRAEYAKWPTSPRWHLPHFRVLDETLREKGAPLTY